MNLVPKNESRAGAPGDWVNSSSFVFIALVTVLLFAYGFEIFNFNLTIDEEVHAIQSKQWTEWIVQGRWGMAVLNFFLLQNPIAPVTSTFLGVSGVALGVLIFTRNAFRIEGAGLITVTSIAATIPTLAFTLAFSTIAYGIGVGFLALAIGHSFLRQERPIALLFACLVTGFALGVYQTFVFAVLMMAAVTVFWRDDESKLGFVGRGGYPATYCVGSIATYLMLNWMALRVAPLDAKYLGQFVDIHGFLQNPIARSTSSLIRNVQIFQLDAKLFGNHSVWLGVFVLLALALSILSPLLRRDYAQVRGVCAVLLFAFAIVILADAIANGHAPLRSLIHVPVAVALLSSLAYVVSGPHGKKAMMAACCLAVVGNSQVMNHLFGSSALAEFRDRMLAQEIIGEVRTLVPAEGNNKQVVRLEVVGSHDWPASGIQSKREVFGASFFEWDEGSSVRIAAYLRINGLRVLPASTEDRVRAYELQRTMTSWPSKGWVRMSEDLVILKFGEYSSTQKADLCAAGIAELCK